MKILKFLLYTVLAIALFIVAAGLFAKKDYHIERSWEIIAPKAVIYDQLANFKNFHKWSPWSDLDPAMSHTINNLDGKVGASYAWKGDKKVGTGSITTTAMTENRIDMNIKFTEPWDKSMPAFYKIEEMGKNFKVSWASDMHVPFPYNAFAMFTDVDKAIGNDYEKGLVRLKKTCEDLAQKPYSGYTILEADAPVRYFSGIRKVVGLADMDKFFMENMTKAAELTTKAGGKIQESAAPTGMFFSYDTIKMNSDCAAVFALKNAIKLGGGVQVFIVGGKKSVSINFYGNPAGTASAHYGIEEYMTEKGLKILPPGIEEYIIGAPAEKDTAKWLTRITYFSAN
jgi:effector-binding domain-containing protein